ncbi:unnamed protein product [Protopolystoma xenopodis]|uniref:Uncharacterized protein n=1 Tax=Protopolystoma xenopodis TaxID=117903 RepID=A0A3S5C0M0_9PLAT|nr:unnamed protein product [Protopolystoma xenopodis]
MSGVRVNHAKSVFTTRTLPSHHSIATGLYQESHGIVNNEFIDPELKISCSLYNHSSLLDSLCFDTGVEPIWLTNQRHRHKSAVFFWPGSEARIRGELPFISAGRYVSGYPLKDRIDKIIEWLTNSEINFAMLYFHEPDKTGHTKGPNSHEILDRLSELNEALDYLLNRLEENSLGRINFILTSDHGMSEMNTSKIIIMDKIISPELYYVYGRTESIWGIWPTNGNSWFFNALDTKSSVDTIYTILIEAKPKNLHVYRKQDLPPRLHYTMSRRISPIVIYCDPGSSIVRSEADAKLISRFI